MAQSCGSNISCLAIVLKNNMDISKRAKLIRRATPNILEELFEMQNRICDLCNKPIQDLIFAALDHSIPVISFAKGSLSIKKAIQAANDLSNLRAVHKFCNSSKGDMTREEWFAKGMNEKVGEPRIWTQIEIEEFRKRLAKGPHLGGRKMVESGKLSLLRTPEHQIKAARAGGRIGGKIGGRISGRKNAESGHLARIRNLPQSNIENGVLIKAGHIRWHINRGITSPDCLLCFPVPMKPLPR
jgi:hypothetical protein